MASLRDIIIRPVITEKTNGLMAEGKYTFVVDPRASKGVIKQAIEDKFKVKVKDVNTSRVQGKIRRMGRHVGRQPSWKKAVVTLEAWQKIEFFEGM